MAEKLHCVNLIAARYISTVNFSPMTVANSEPHLLKKPEQMPIPLEAGDRLDRETFHARYEAMGPGVRAELIGGQVYMPSPVRRKHGRPHGLVVHWLFNYEKHTPGVETLDDTSALLATDSEPQPDAAMRIINGGQTTLTSDDYIEGCPELVAEAASSTESYDLHAKLADYEKYGAIEYVVVVVRTCRVIWFRRNGDKLVEIAPDADGIHRSCAFPGLWLDPAALLAADLHRLGDVVDQGVASPEHAAFVARIKV
jgi:Uma2 family endonuclease